MTQEEATYEAFPEAGYVVFGIPDVPYSSVRLPLVWNLDEFNVLVAQAMESAKLVREAFQEAFLAPSPLRIEFSDVVPSVSPSPARAAQPRPAARSARANSDLDPDLIVQGNCPEHGVAAAPSILKYQEIEMSDEGEERYAKYFCPGQHNGTGKNHPLWARELV